MLFDLDGTFADTAPDMAFAANVLRNARGLDSLPLALYRPQVSRGGRGIISVAFNKTPDDAEFIALRDEFLDIYAANLCAHTVFFDGMLDVVDALERQDIAWGIVTNKARRFTDQLSLSLGLTQRTNCIVSGDTTAHAKPHPAPLLYAAQLLGLPADQCWYVGDDQRDIIAAHAAGMTSVAAAYGYLGESDPQRWGAHHTIAAPIDLLELIGQTPICSA